LLPAQVQDRHCQAPQRGHAAPHPFAQPAVFLLPGSTGLALQGGHELRVHGDQIIQQRFLRLVQKARSERITLVGLKAADLPGVIGAHRCGQAL
jgi:hypothetical protein